MSSWGIHLKKGYKKEQINLRDLRFFCGKRGIRTLGTRKGTTVFETVPIDHSGIFPMVCRF